MTAVREREFAPPPDVPPVPPRARHVRQLPRRLVVTEPIGPVRLTVSWLLALLAFCALWFVFFATVLSSLQEAHAQHNAYALFREELTQLSPRTAPLGGTITPDAPVALIDAPALGLHQVVVVEGTASGDLAQGPGHQRNTPLPGQAGVSVIAGRAHLFGGAFGGLARGRVGEQLTVTTGQGVARYRVEDVRHVGERYPPALGAGDGQLTLVSSEGGSWRNGWLPARPIYLDAKLIGPAFGTPPGRLTGIPDAEKTMHGDIGALIPLVLWLPLLVLAGAAVVWLAERWGRWQTWLVGAPVVLAALWGVSETAAQLLPNLS